MSRIASFANLTDREWERLQQAADRLEEAWRLAAPTAVVNLNIYAPLPGDPLRPVILCELVKTDLEIRCRRGQTVALEQYLERYPELGGQSADLPIIVYQDYRVRHLYGDKLDLEQYRTRFPEQFSILPDRLNAEPVRAPIVPRKPAVLSPAVVPAADASPIGGGYRPIKQLGRGNYGEVWKAHAPDESEVAVKVIWRPIDGAGMKREKDMLQMFMSLRHPHLVRVDSGQSLEDRILIPMELAGSSLRDMQEAARLAGQVRFSRRDLLPYFHEAAEALDYLRSQGVPHRDIKPENMLLLDGHAKVADFGLERLQVNRSVSNAPACGTPRFIPPEGWRGQLHAQSDQYSLALVYAELRLGRAVFPDGDGARIQFLSVMLAHLEGRPDLGDLPPAEQEVLLRALEKEPDHRYPDCRSLVSALAAAAKRS